MHLQVCKTQEKAKEGDLQHFGHFRGGATTQSHSHSAFSEGARPLKGGATTRTWGATTQPGFARKPLSQLNRPPKCQIDQVGSKFTHDGK